MALLTGALLPVAYSITSEKRYARACYQRAVAMEIVDGEMEVLLAGEWRAFKAGLNDYQPTAASATNLPPGRFLLRMEDRKLHLEWRPDVKQHGGPIIREATIK